MTARVIRIDSELSVGMHPRDYRCVILGPDADINQVMSSQRGTPQESHAKLDQKAGLAMFLVTFRTKLR
jgi:hypothetical protein